MSENFIITIGKYKNRQIKDIDLVELDSYLGWIEKQDDVRGRMLILKEAITEYLQDPVIAEQLDRELERI